MKRTSPLRSILHAVELQDRVSHFCTDIHGHQKKWLRDDHNIEHVACEDIVVFSKVKKSKLIGQPFGDQDQTGQRDYRLHTILVRGRLYQMEEVRLRSEQLTDGEVLHYIISAPPHEVHSTSRKQEELLERLSSREVEVLTLMAQGYSMTKIATRLHLSHHTIDSHRLKLCKKLKVKRTTELAIWAHKFGLLIQPEAMGVS